MSSMVGSASVFTLPVLLAVGFPPLVATASTPIANNRLSPSGSSITHVPTSTPPSWAARTNASPASRIAGTCGST